MTPLNNLTLKTIYSTVALLILLAPLYGQLNVIHIEGKAYYNSIDENQTQYIELSYGPLKDAKTIILKENSQVTLVNDNNEVCNLLEGEFTVDELVFNTTENKSGFEKFCDYFKSFFLHHDASESKKYYVNNIYAITRGEQQPPVLDFPLEGNISFDFGSIPFMWTHSADSAEYIFTIQDLSSSEIVFSSMTSKHAFLLTNPDKYLKVGHSYFWSVKVAGQKKEIEYNKSIVEISPIGKAKTSVSTIKSERGYQEDTTISTADFIYLLSLMEEKGMENEAIQYGLSHVDSSGSKSEKIILENFMYDIIAETNLDF